MKVLLVYRNRGYGFSITRVFRCVETHLSNYVKVESFELPSCKCGVFGLIKNVISLKLFLKSHDYDIVHITGSEHYLIPFIKGKVVITVHDLGFYTNHKNLFFRSKWKWITHIFTLRYASAITCISNKTYTELRSVVGSHIPTKTFVVNNPVRDDYQFTFKVFNYQEPVILHIGTGPNKNLERVIEAISVFNCKLVIVGRLSETVYDLINKYKVNVENKYRLTDEEIHNEYLSCDIVSFPSLYEGFGMPIIEGQAIGRVVVTSMLSPTQEIAGDGAVLVDPYSVVSIREGFRKAIEDSTNYVFLGLSNVEKFSGEQIAKDYYSVYLSLVS